MCIPLTPVFLTTVLIEVYSQNFTESVSLRDIGKSTSRAEISSPSSVYFKAVKGAHIGSALVLLGELTSNCSMIGSYQVIHEASGHQSYMRYKQGTRSKHGEFRQLEIIYVNYINRG